MSSVLDNFRDNSGELIQPYYAAFMIEFGFPTVEEGRNDQGNQMPFMLWIQARWREFGVPEKDMPFHREGFHKWLSDRALDQLARISVEGKQKC
jgi:hypothetical protein